MVCIAAVAPAIARASEEKLLPHGDAPAALESGYFPDRLHEFVWRNWNSIEPEKLAKVLRTSAENVTAIATSMGLPSTAAVPPEMLTRGYSTIIRRNWHLLPYEQILELVEMTPQRLSFILREEDFLWWKLGNLKPKCDRLVYVEPTATARERASEIRNIVEQDFGPAMDLPAEPRFEFVRQLSSPLSRPPAARTDSEIASLRFVYSYLALYGDPLLNPKLDPYPDAFLQRLSAVGVNGVWLHVVLRDLAPGGPTFPEFGKDHEQRLENLRDLVRRAKKHGIGVYLYINEPRAMPSRFFEAHPEVAGVEETGLRAMCTSTPEVRNWLSDSLTYVFRAVPALGGVYAITASENLTSCGSHTDSPDCVRCKERGSTEIIAEVVSLIEQGVHRGNPDAKVIISDWGWEPWARDYEAPVTGQPNKADLGAGPDIIARLPESVWLMAVSEWHVPIERGGVKTLVGEYSMSSVGPGRRALRHWEAAHKKGIKVAAEIQFNNTCEIASLPYIPVMDLVAEHCHNLALQNLDGMLIGWTMGGYPSLNFELADRINHTPVPNVKDVLDTLADERFGPEGAPHGRRAWTLMSDAFRQYPFHIRVVYNCPVQHGPANPLYASRTGYKASGWGIPYDDLETWRGIYPADVFAGQFDRMAQEWLLGVRELQIAVDKAPADRRGAAQVDLRMAKAAQLHFQSVGNQARFVIARDELAKGGDSLSRAKQEEIHARIRQCIESEIELARELYPLAQADARIGFEPSCQYFYLPQDLIEKVINCRWLMEQYQDPAVAAGSPPQTVN
jgi:hypothetical protein